MDLQRIARALLFLRLSVFIVMIMWTLDKFLNPAHTSAVFEHFYGLADVPGYVFTILGVLQLIVVLAFVAGFKKRISYGIVLLLPAMSTFSSWEQYLDGFNNLLFFAAWPMLAACFALYSLRDLDPRWNIDDRK